MFNYFILLLHAVTSHSLPVDSLRNLDGGDSGQSGASIRHKQLQSQVGEASVKMISAESVSPPGVLQALLRHHGQPLSESVHGVDRSSVVVDTTLVWPAIPVLSQPRQI